MRGWTHGEEENRGRREGMISLLGAKDRQNTKEYKNLTVFSQKSANDL